MKGLVNKAKQSKAPKMEIKNYPDDEIDLAIAWTYGEVTLAQCGRALEKRGKSPATYIAYLLRNAVQKGRLVEK